MCQTVENSEFFLQHYGLCAMESLELMEAHEEIITFCEKSIDFLTPKKAERTDEWFRKKLELFDLKYGQFTKKDYEIKHLRRVIWISRDELDFYSSFRFWSYYPSMVIGLLSLIFWIKFYVKNQKTNES